MLDLQVRSSAFRRKEAGHDQQLKNLSTYRLPYWLCGLVIIACGLPGCGPGPTNRIMVHGKVTYQGQPVESGTILFSPTTEGQYQANGVIEDGEYLIDADYGPSLGTYKIRIDGFRATGQSTELGPLHAADNGSVEELEPYIPVEFNSQTTLSVDISAQNAAALNFEL